MFKKKKKMTLLVVQGRRQGAFSKRFASVRLKTKGHFSQNPAHFIGKVEVDRRPFSLSAIHGPG
jgi:hypothetical protein